MDWYTQISTLPTQDLMLMCKKSQNIGEVSSSAFQQRKQQISAIWYNNGNTESNFLLILLHNSSK